MKEANENGLVKRIKGRHFGSSNAWRYRVIKRYKRRAETFANRAKTPEERAAWLEVAKWFESILARKYLSRKGDINLPYVQVDDPENSEGERSAVLPSGDSYRDVENPSLGTNEKGSEEEHGSAGSPHSVISTNGKNTE